MRVTSCPGLPETFQVSALKVLHPRKRLRPWQTRTAGHRAGFHPPSSTYQAGREGSMLGRTLDCPMCGQPWLGRSQGPKPRAGLGGTVESSRLAGSSGWPGWRKNFVQSLWPLVLQEMGNPALPVPGAGLLPAATALTSLTHSFRDGVRAPDRTSGALSSNPFSSRPFIFPSSEMKAWVQGPLTFARPERLHTPTPLIFSLSPLYRC